MSEELNKLEQLFHDALELTSPEERAAYLAQACGADAVLRQRVEKLLRAHQTAGQFLNPETPSVQNGEPPACEQLGDQIGHYTLLERIGEGGYCVVYLAQQLEPVRRQVALKLIKAGMDTRQVVARFEVERQALALMDHPHIAKVFDGGVTKSGRPYFVMELVRGVPITQYCDEQRLTVKQRLELFMQVCHAVQHAHQKGIIHRDLKPSNILVTINEAEPSPLIGPPGTASPAHPDGHDGEKEKRGRQSTALEQPCAKVIDFGVAKAMQASITERAVSTWVGQFVGTPAYMSPEQAGMNNEDIDARTDIYSLGALLYELLTGVTPFAAETLADGGFDEIRRMVQETEPSKPSARLDGLGQRVAEAAKQRQTEPGMLRRSIKGDLDWIVMKALEKNRQRRYETANHLAEDIQRHLEHLPVLAGPPSAVYWAGKFVRRHRVGVAVVGVVTLALMAGLSLALVGLERALVAEEEMRNERDRAVQAEADTRVILDLLSDKLSAGEEMIPLLHASARIARDRLGPTNPASLKFLVPSAQNLGRLGAWTNALEVYRWLIESDPNNADLWERAHAAALVGAQPDVSRKLRQEMVKRFAVIRDPTNCLRLARALLISPDYQFDLKTAVQCARVAFRARTNDPSCQLVLGMAEYRQGNWSEALTLLQEAERSASMSISPLSCAFVAMGWHQSGQAAEARAALDRFSVYLRLPLQMGQFEPNYWHETVYALSGRAEAERLILGEEVSPKVTAGFMSMARERWKSVYERLAQGEALAREGKWNESRDAYAQVLAHPLLDWTAAEDLSFARCLSLHMGTVFAQSGDSTNHRRLCRLLLGLHPENPTTPKEERDATVRADRYAKACFLYARGLSPELRQGALDLARFAVENQRRKKDHSTAWICQTAGIAEYYAGQPERAIELLQEAEQYRSTFIAGPARLFRAMALKKLKRADEAAQVLQDTDELYSSSPDLNSILYWWDAQLYKLALQEARQIIPAENK